MAKQTGVYQMRVDDEFKHALNTLADQRKLRSADVIRQLVFDEYRKLGIGESRDLNGNDGNQ